MVKPDYNGAKHFGRFDQKLEKGNTSKGVTFLAENFRRDEPFHLNSPRNYRVFYTNGKRSLFASPWAFEKCPTNALGKG